MDLLAVENDIITKLSTDITSLDVQSFLRDPSEYKLIKNKGAILVRNLGSNSQPPDPNKKKNVNQIRTFTWSVIVAYKGPSVKHYNSTETESVYTFTEAVRTSLIGYTISTDPHFSVFEAVDDALVGEYGGVFYWEMTFKHEIETTHNYQT